MTSPERRRNDSSNEGHAKPYIRATRFKSDDSANRIYQKFQHEIFVIDCDLSVYRFRMDGVWYVAVVGKDPPAKLDQKIEALLASEEAVTLPTVVAKDLLARRSEKTRYGPWVEGHYGPDGEPNESSEQQE